jgi:CBS domain-containing protein
MNINKVMVPEDVIAFLKNIPPFQFLNESDLRTVAASLTMEFYPKDTVILRQDDPVSDALRIIKKGGVKISIRTDHGDEAIIDHRGEGDTFGLISLMGKEEKQKTTITAMEDTICYLLKKDEVLSVIETNPAITEYFLKFHFEKYIDKTYREIHSKSLFYGSSDHLLFTTPVGEIATKEVITVDREASIQEAARVMARHRISSAVVIDDAFSPVGIVTDRDLREKVVAKARDVRGPVRDIMTLPLVRADVKEFCFEAVLKMIKHNIHHVLVIKDGRLHGVLTNHDLMMLQGTSPLSFAKDLENQTAIDGLVPVSSKINRVVGLLLKEGAKASNITRIITELNDRLVRKVLEITEKQFGRPPVPYCWMSFGSEGRKEQTFRTDQDNAILFADPESEEQEAAAQRYFSAFALSVRDSLVKCGFPACEADYMASNPKWCQPLKVWKKYFHSWVATPTPDAILRSLIFFDFRCLYGDPTLAGELRSYLDRILTGQNLFLAQMASVTTKNRPPLGFFRTFLVEKNGEHRDELNLKFSGIGPLVDVVRLLALESLVHETSTLERIEAMKGKNPTITDIGDELAQAFEFINLLRIHHQVEQMDRGEPPDNFINPSNLSNLEKRILKESFQVVSRVQDSIIDQYGPGMVGG